MLIRNARLDDINTVLSLFEGEVRAGRMLPRSAACLRTHLDDWLVAEAYGQVIGCVSLVYFNQALCEVRSLAVRPDHRGNGIAAELVTAAVDMARANQMRHVLALTRAPRVFERVGFRRDTVTNFPEKVWRDCGPCPFRSACDEIALLYDLYQEVTHG